MRINVDLLRGILIDVADCPFPTVRSNRSFIYPETTQGEIDYHIHLLIDNGYLKGLNASSKDAPYQYLEIELTLAGQNFLDSIADNTVWEKTKKYLKENAMDFTFKTILFVSTKISAK